MSAQPWLVALTCKLAGCGSLEANRKPNGDAFAVSFYLTEEFVLLTFSRRYLRRLEVGRCVAGLDFECESLAVHVITRGNAIFGDELIAVHPGAQAEGFFRR